MNPKLPGDSGDYHLLEKGIELSATIEGLTCELGVRRGGGTGVIMDAIKKNCPGKVHVGVDPYGHIEYEHKEGQRVRLDYTNDMRDECMQNLFEHARQNQQPFLFYNLEDTEFFKRFSDGVPVYNLHKAIINKYSFVHFDAAHALNSINEQIDFFKDRTPVGGCWCFDDITGYYDHSLIEERLTLLGFVTVQKTWHKGLYQKVANL